MSEVWDAIAELIVAVRRLTHENRALAARVAELEKAASEKKEEDQS